MVNDQVGISGFAAYLPPYRVDLQDWCEWTGNDWEKIRNVVGTGFRMLGPAQSVYTLAATATLRLIDQYEIDPQRIRFLGLGTESSTDNSAGAVIVKGMLDEALRQRGQNPFRSAPVDRFEYLTAEPLRIQCEAFARYVDGGAEPRTTGQRALRVMAVIDAARRSLLAGSLPTLVSFEESVS